MYLQARQKIIQYKALSFAWVLIFLLKDSLIIKSDDRGLPISNILSQMLETPINGLGSYT